MTQDEKDRELLVRLDERVRSTFERIEQNFASTFEKLEQKLLTISDRLSSIEENKASAQVQRDHERQIVDHEKRIRAGERQMYKIAGGLVLIEAIGFAAFFKILN